MTYISWSSDFVLFDGWMLYWRHWFGVTHALNWNYTCRSVTYISWSSDFALYIEDYLMDKCHNWNTGSVWCKNLPHKMYLGQRPTFHGPVILSYSLKNIWWMNVVLGILIRCDTNTKRKYKCRSVNTGSVWCKDLPHQILWVRDLHFMVQWFCFISWRLFKGLMLYWRYWFNVTQTLKWNYRYRPVTYIQWFCLYILQTFWWTNVITGIFEPCDAKINHIKCMWVSDLHFVVQWFWLISWRRFDGGMLDWRYWFSVTLSFTYNYICKSMTYSLWYNDPALYFQYYLMNKPHSGYWFWYWPLTCISWLSDFESFTW